MQTKEQYEEYHIWKPSGNPYRENAPLDPKRCKARVSDAFVSHQCNRKPWKEGWCKQHHYDSVVEREKKQREKWEAKSRREMLPYKTIKILQTRVKELEKELNNAHEAAKRRLCE